MRRWIHGLVYIVVIAIWTMTAGAAPPPATKTVEQVDVYHGVSIADPYRWLETDVRESEDVAQWVEAQNSHTNAWLEQIPQRAAIKARLTKLWNFEKFSVPTQVAGASSTRRTTACRTSSCCTCRPARGPNPRC